MRIKRGVVGSGVVFTILVAILILAVQAQADSWAAPKETEYSSPSGEYRLLVSPPRDLQKPGYCKATLYRVTPTGHAEVWSRYLINNVAPVRALVANSGTYTVTMDEWHRVGDFPVVIYGSKGNLISVHSMDSLALDGDPNIKRTVSSYWWSEDATIFFGPEGKTLFIRLHWAKTLIIDLRTGSLMDEAWYAKHDHEITKEEWKSLQEFGARKSQEIAHTLLGSSHTSERRRGILLAGQLQLRQAIPRLRELLADNAMHWRSQGDSPLQRIYHIRQAAKEALEKMGETVGDVVVEEAETERTLTDLGVKQK